LGSGILCFVSTQFRKCNVKIKSKNEKFPKRVNELEFYFVFVAATGKQKKKFGDAAKFKPYTMNYYHQLMLCGLFLK